MAKIRSREIINDRADKMLKKSSRTNIQVGKIPEKRNDELSKNSKTTICGYYKKKSPKYSVDKMTQLFQAAIRLEDEKKKIKGVPVARYDIVTKKAYLEYANGERVYV